MRYVHEEIVDINIYIATVSLSNPVAVKYLYMLWLCGLVSQGYAGSEEDRAGVVGS